MEGRNYTYIYSLLFQILYIIIKHFFSSIGLICCLPLSFAFCKHKSLQKDFNVASKVACNQNFQTCRNANLKVEWGLQFNVYNKDVQRYKNLVNEIIKKAITIGGNGTVSYITRAR